MMMPRPLSGCQMKAEIQCFLLMYGLFQYQQWFSQDIERPWIPEMTSAPCRTFNSDKLGGIAFTKISKLTCAVPRCSA